MSSSTIHIQRMDTGSVSVVHIPAEVKNVQDLKQQVQMQLGIPAKLQRLFFVGRELVDQELLPQAGIANGVTVQLLLRRGAVSLGTHPRSAAPVFTMFAAAVPAEEQIALTQEQADHLIDLHWLARVVRILALIDWIFLLLFSAYYWPFLFGSLIALCGYIGASTYSPSLVFVYLFYQLAEVAVRIYWAIVHEHSATYVIFSVFAVALELWLASFSWRLVAKLSQLTDEERALHDRVLAADYTFWASPTVVRLVEYNTTQPAHHHHLAAPPDMIVPISLHSVPQAASPAVTPVEAAGTSAPAESAASSAAVTAPSPAGSTRRAAGGPIRLGDGDAQVRASITV